MKVYCVHFLWAKDGKIVDMPPRTVSKLEDAGVIITLNGEPSGEQIFMNWEPDTKNHCWVGESEIAWNIKAMAHEKGNSLERTIIPENIKMILEAMA